MRILITRAHDWRYTGGGWAWGDTGTGWDRLQRQPHNGRVCMDCGLRQSPSEFGSRSPCTRKGETLSSGYSGVILDNGKYAGRINMRGKYPVTGKPYVQTTWKGN